MLVPASSSVFEFVDAVTGEVVRADKAAGALQEVVIEGVFGRTIKTPEELKALSFVECQAYLKLQHRRCTVWAKAAETAEYGYGRYYEDEDTRKNNGFVRLHQPKEGESPWVHRHLGVTNIAAEYEAPRYYYTAELCYVVKEDLTTSKLEAHYAVLASIDKSEMISLAMHGGLPCFISKALKSKTHKASVGRVVLDVHPYSLDYRGKAIHDKYLSMRQLGFTSEAVIFKAAERANPALLRHVKERTYRAFVQAWNDRPEAGNNNINVFLHEFLRHLPTAAQVPIYSKTLGYWVTFGHGGKHTRVGEVSPASIVVDAGDEIANRPVSDLARAMSSGAWQAYTTIVSEMYAVEPVEASTVQTPEVAQLNEPVIATTPVAVCQEQDLQQVEHA